MVRSSISRTGLKHLHLAVIGRPLLLYVLPMISRQEDGWAVWTPTSFPSCAKLKTFSTVLNT
ncbi:hypothetical protein NECAME_19084 [Necator americanus]|uniref:Uncharacterized protein n=1 Tax=Necator americanus TaxID=51031 RepID=W2SQF6_NECAM|nr:hypothetical protein NECAME_19084 [Necator americanus]ETN71959.1 hypothetical protein NECAME_19084 [Necator americanus]